MPLPTFAGKKKIKVSTPKLISIKLGMGGRKKIRKNGTPKNKGLAAIQKMLNKIK